MSNADAKANTFSRSTIAPFGELEELPASEKADGQVPIRLMAELRRFSLDERQQTIQMIKGK